MLWQVSAIATSPVLVTGRILSIHRNERVPESQLSWKAETWSMTADVDVLRSFTAGGTPLASRRIAVHFLSYGPNAGPFINGDPPPLPEIRAGETLILPLKENRNPEREPWQLMADSGADLVIPAGTAIDGESAPPPGARAFLIREFANTLSRGAPGEVVALSGYLSRQYEDLSGELMPLLGPAIGDSRQQWAEIAASLDAGFGAPRPTIAEIFEGKFQPHPPLQANLPLLRAALLRLRPSPATDDLLIRTWIANAPFNAWGPATSLIEYASNPVTTETLRQALRQDLRGSSYIAMTLVNHGNTAILPDAVARAFRVIDDPAGFGDAYNEVQGAAALLRDHGSDADLARLAAIVKKYQTRDPKYYSLLWQDSTGMNSPREFPVLDVVLTDRGAAFRTLRTCDLALGEFNRITNTVFDIEAASIPERDAAISRALARIKTR
jgi:hypothetical protein